jgi:transcriptional antiterminator RfaH
MTKNQEDPDRWRGAAAAAELGSGAGRRWYAVQCLSNREAGAAAQLENQDFPVFLPRRRKTRRHARRIESVVTPFFPGYLFVTLDLSRDRWRCVNGTYGVARLVMRGDMPAPVPAGIVETLQQSCDEDGVIHWQAEIKPGQRVQIVEGALAEFVGQLERLDAAGRVRILLNILGRRTPIVLPRESVIPAEDVH